MSEFIRRAAVEDAEETLALRPSERFADVSGAIRGGGGQARRTGMAFADALLQDRTRG